MVLSSDEEGIHGSLPRLTMVHTVAQVLGGDRLDGVRHRHYCYCDSGSCIRGGRALVNNCCKRVKNTGGGNCRRAAGASVQKKITQKAL